MPSYTTLSQASQLISSILLAKANRMVEDQEGPKISAEAQEKSTMYEITK